MKHLKLLSVLILIVSALLLSGGRNANAQSQNPRSDQHNGKATPHAEYVKQQEPQVPFSVWQTTVSALHESLAANEQKAIATQKQTEAAQQTFCSPAVVVNEVLAAIGVGYLIFMYLQWDAIDKQARTAQKTLDAIKNQAEIADRELIIANRAYLYLSKVRISLYESEEEFPGDAPVHNYVITYPIHNGGQTPALYVGAFARTTVDDKAPQEVSPAALALDRTQNAIVPPHSVDPLNPTYRSFLSEKEFADIQTRQHSLFFYGVLTYFDVFQEKRHTWFALSYKGPVGNDMSLGFVTAVGLNRFD